MRRLARLWTAVAVATILLTPGQALAVQTRTIRIINFAFDPTFSVSPHLGDTIHWLNDTPANTHTATSLGVGAGTVGLALWDSGPIPPGGTFDYLAGIAGSFPYRCEINTSMTSTLSVMPKASPKTGPSGTIFKVKVSLAASPPAGMVYDVQVMGGVFGAVWNDFATGVTAPKVTFDSTGMGTATFEFRSRLRRTSDDVASGWSPAASIYVTWW